MILARKKSFKNKPENNDVVFEEFLGKELYGHLNWCDRTSFMIIDKMIFINAHLSSKADKNKEQVDIMKSTLLQVKQKMPVYEIVVAGDLNSFVDQFSE